MNNNDILRRVRYALKIKDTEMITIFSLANISMKLETLLNLLKKEEEEDFLNCEDSILSGFLNGLILHRRGPRESEDGKAAPKSAAPAESMNNNLVMKKLRIAMEFKETEMLETLALAGVTISKGELTALFRKRGQRNYKNCGDQLLRNFIKGLTMRLRGGPNPS
ncbi:MAG: DUF1456 domain-containing protein [Candidatus Wallbacteria bacterium HGW-Wallbacteria-1]|jgi:uncharacterized protein YehS (DUF1456 family)|uniref:DUF1456 domain-containing protein n=1 Tax=Candidatus Wallbacteria bacterium HGW-Wallbacteria-1 TaxID=2013854 RepID=A0A2N1PKK6_9BACT|nr:MAG: DUF1456 domain-containing protein [Candidatus Wallbacteria bacterium HGW-Wallbacteria-1]